jgi:PAS domain S-box-containing protein
MVVAVPFGAGCLSDTLWADAALTRLVLDYRWHVFNLVTVVSLGAGFVVLLLLRQLAYAEARLRDTETRMNLAIHAAGLGLWDWDIGENRIWGTEECRKLYGFGNDEPIYFQSFLDRLHPDDREATRQTIERALAENADYRCEYRVFQADGNLRWLTVQGRGTYDSRGQAVRLLGISMDINERKQAEQELQRQSAALAHMGRLNTLAELSTTLAHELNQPLGAILGNAQAARRFLERTPPDLDEVRTILDDIVADELRTGEIVSHLRSLCKKEPVRFQSLTLDSLIEGVAKLLRNDLMAKHVSLALALTADLPEVCGDPVQLQQVLLNLLMNSVDAMTATSAPVHRVEVASARFDIGQLQVSVWDSGSGLTPEVMAHIFEPFVTTKPNGLGMGLVISRSIIAAHGGQLWAENHPDGGALFRFTLPIDARDPT